MYSWVIAARGRRPAGLGEGRKVRVRPSHMLVTGHESGLTASNARAHVADRTVRLKAPTELELVRIRGAASLPVGTTHRPCFANVRACTPRLRSSSAARVRHARERHVRRFVRLTSERHLLHVKYRQRQTWTWRWILGRRRRGSGPTRREVPQNPACRRGLSAARHANSGTTKILRGLSGFLAQTDAWRSTHSGPYITGPDQSQTAGHVRRAKVVHSLLTARSEAYAAAATAAVIVVCPASSPSASPVTLSACWETTFHPSQPSSRRRTSW